ncbi:serine/threonine-protein kinase [Streptomyces sp. NPDC058221]|uniref:serine/threonine-protein kinase n=1 Tax=Streptomyces sp. NPDC058221 TaxID=3346388 RepID=UPI0036F1629C
MRDHLLGGRYRLIRQLGEGGMGQVWEAHDGTLERLVAVKVITLLSGGGSRGGEARTRFLREARITALLQHPNIVTVHDLGETESEDGKAPFLVMERLRGEGLDVVLRRGPVGLAEAAEWGAQICDALAEAHRADVLHRDIKPSNIHVLPSGAAKVLDFGIARAADPYATADRITQTGFIVGTPPYMAPEQARGHPEARSDLYALGCLLFEMITGRLPFLAPDTVGYLTAHLTQEAPAPSSVAEGIPAGWDEVVLMLLRKDPRERNTSAGELAGVLRQLGRAPWHPPTVVDRGGPAAELAQARRREMRELATALRRLEHKRARVRTQQHQPEQRQARQPAQQPARRQTRESERRREREEPSGHAFASSTRDLHPGEFARPLGPRVSGFCVKALIGAVVLVLWAVVYHQFHPEEGWMPVGPDYAVIAIVLIVCAVWEYDRAANEKKAPYSRIRLEAGQLTVEQEVMRQGRTRVAVFSVPWVAIDRIGVEGPGRGAPVVVWFRTGSRPTTQWLQQNGAGPHPSGEGYILCHPARAASGQGPANAVVRRLRTELAAYAHGKHVVLSGRPA